jgi:DNA-binding NtrC family response regulator
MLAALKKWLSGLDSESGDEAASPLERRAYVIDDDPGICNFVRETLVGLGISSESFHTAKEALAAFDHDRPALILLDVALLQSDAIDVVHGLNARAYGGIVHLMSGGNPSLVKAVERIGARKGLRFGVPLSKPVRREAIVTLIENSALAPLPK